MNYEINFEKFVKTSLIYNETQSEVYKNLSNDTQSIVLGISKKSMIMSMLILSLI